MTTVSKPVVSVITVVYNRVRALEETILSVLNLDYHPVEYIIIDGGSTDGTVGVIQKYKDRLAYWVSEPDAGIYDAMNKGIAAATGEWINFMNCGDQFASGVALSFFARREFNAAILYGDAIIRYPGFEARWPVKPLSVLWKGVVFCHQAAFVRAEVMKKFNFDLHYRFSSDFDFFYKAWLAGYRFEYVPVLICRYDFTEGASIDHRLVSLLERRHAVLRNRLSVRKWLYFLMAAVYLRLATFLKSIIGPRLTQWITRSLRM